MNKMLKRRKRRKLSKLLKKATFPKKRKPTPPPTKIFKDKSKYSRLINKRVEEKEKNG